MKPIFCILFSLLSLNILAQNNYTREWHKVDSLNNLGQPKTALDMVIGIYNQAKAANQADQFVKASLCRMQLESDYQEDYYEKSIARTELEIQSAKAPAKQILYSIVAELYWRYYQENRWKILERTGTAKFEQKDLKTWDLRKIVVACIENYDSSLTQMELLKNTQLTDYEEILIKGENSKTFRPTLFDLLAHRAIDFYSWSDANLTTPAVTFTMNDIQYFGSSTQFAALPITSPDSFSFEFQAMKLLQEAIKFHQNDADPTALIDVDLDRLSFVHFRSTISEKDSLYLLVLSQLANHFKNHPSSTEIAYQIALQLSKEVERNEAYDDEETSKPAISSSKKWNKKKAVEICQAAIDRFPDSFEANNCRSLIEQIKQSSLSITTNEMVVIGKPSLALVNYQSTPKVYFRILKTNADTIRELQQKEGKVFLNKLRSMKPEKSWEQLLPDEGDYLSHSAEIKIPALPAGYYVLLASNDSSFPDSLAIVTSCIFQVSNISFISRNNSNKNNELIVLQRETGKPLAGVKVQMFFQKYNQQIHRQEYVSGETYISDQTGKVIIPSSKKDYDDRGYHLKFSLDEDQLVSESYFYLGYGLNNESQTNTQTHFFTDRAIYRPGQTIYFKGITLESKGKEVKIKPGFQTEVTLYDNNGQVVSKKRLIANDFGSFAGSFTAPQGVLTGYMNIRCETGSISVRVEEYKRPKFEVKFEPVKGSFKLGELLTVKGKAMAYAGSSVSDAKVHYRVVRQARFPYYCWFWRPMPQSAEMEITNGDAKTGNDGSFEIKFNAIPDLSVDKKDNPVFDYTVYADVSDINGESHSAETSVSVGYQALLVKTDLADDVNLEKGFQFSLETTNLNDVKENASGSIQIFRLRKPDQVLFARKWQRPDQFTMSKKEFEKEFPNEVYNDEDELSTWPKERIYEDDFKTPADSIFKPKKDLQAGTYLIEIKTKDAFGEAVLYQKYFSAFQPKSKQTEASSPIFFSLLTPVAEPGQDVQFLIGTRLKNTSIVYEIMQQDKMISREILNLNDEQKLISIPVKEEYRGNFSVNIAMVNHNRSFLQSKLVNVPFTNKKLAIQFATFRSKLQPGQDEEWQITLRDSKGEKAVTEMLATMYDASLDAFAPNNWDFSLYRSYYNSQPWSDNQCFGFETGNQLSYPEFNVQFLSRDYDQLDWFGFGNQYSEGLVLKRKVLIDIGELNNQMAGEDTNTVSLSVSEIKGTDEENAPLKSSMKFTPPVIKPDEEDSDEMIKTQEEMGGNLAVKNKQEPQPIQIRKNFNETAFFYPQLATNENGDIILKFKAPEALTRWKMMGLAYTKDLKYGQIEKTLVTQKDLMLFTNAPRFMREGDAMEFSAKISNISDRDLSGTAELHFFDALTMKPIDALLGLKLTSIPFSTNKGISSAVSWKISIPEGLQAVTYRITASSGDFSDGEEAAIPVLTNRMLITESMPLPINGMQQKNFSFDKLVNSATPGSTLRNYRLSLEYTSNPAWYAVQVLPYLMEYPYECAEQLFSRFYANSLATYMANSDPKIKRVFESWKTISPDAMKSNLEKNEELKSVLLQESPWVREATNESERKQRIALLFDLNRMASEQTAALKKLSDMQYYNGGFPWFARMQESRYITQHIVAGLGHLYSLKVLNPLENTTVSGMLKKAIGFLDSYLQTEFDRIRKNDKDYLKNNHLGYDEIQYLYARTYFSEEFPLTKDFSGIIDYYKSQTSKYWKSGNNYMKAMMALYMRRLGDEKTADLIMRSLKETALHSEEMGMYWRDNQAGWYWYQAPVETQAMLIEAFDEVSNDQQSVEEMKIWLLKQKQTQDWKTTKATTEAIYALLLRGTSLLASDKQVEITVGNEKVDPYKQDGVKPEAGTGYFKTNWDAASIKPEMGKVAVNNPNPTVAWGAMYWQYFEQLDHITPAQTPLSLSKKLFLEVNTPNGPVIEPITEQSTIKVGDKIVVRIELRSDRDMEYIHLKDMRASAFEPVNVLSGYRWQDGLGYYESTRDASTNFFISWLRKGTYVFEYKLVATQKGDFSNGVTTVQCMYAPEFAAHSEGVRVKVE